jgi:hypothetical protein
MPKLTISLSGNKKNYQSVRVALWSILRNFNLLGNSKMIRRLRFTDTVKVNICHVRLQNRGNRHCRHCRRQRQNKHWSTWRVLIGWVKKLGAKHESGVDLIFLELSWQFVGPASCVPTWSHDWRQIRGQTWLVEKAFKAIVMGVRIRVRLPNWISENQRWCLNY